MIQLKLVNYVYLGLKLNKKVFLLQTFHTNKIYFKLEHRILLFDEFTDQMYIFSFFE